MYIYLVDRFRVVLLWIVALWIVAFLIIFSVRAAELKNQDTTGALSGDTLPVETIRSSKFRYLDLNDDGYVSPEEASDDAILRSQYRSLDENNDGRLSEAEYTLFGKAN